MSEKHLHEVVDEIKYLIDQGKANDALPLTHLLLSHYPRYIEGYQLLAEIALEEGYTADAIEVLQRILSADPESFVAHAGLAVAFKNQEQTEDALWHIQRAFEMEPRLREVREEVRQISQLHTGQRPGRLHLNGAALGRMYMREGTHNQAVKQLKSELETQKNRIDLQVALAEAQWFAQRHEDAVRTSRQVLQELPLCLKINLILGQFYAQQEDFGSAERFLHVVQQLDPANELSAAWFGKAGYLQARDVIIPLNDEGSQNGHNAKMPRWLTNLSLFAAHDSEAQQESPALTSIDDSFEFGLESGVVDATPIDEADASPVISIDSDFDFDFSAEPAIDSTETLEPQPAPDWGEEIGTDRDLIEPHFIEEPLEPPPSARRASSPPLSPPLKAKAAWRDALRAKTEAVLVEHQSSDDFRRSSPPETTEVVTTRADWLARLRAETETALVEQQSSPPKTTEVVISCPSGTTNLPESVGIETQTTDISDHMIEWKEKLSAATHAALVERETKQLIDVAEPTFAPFVDAPAKIDWRHGLIAATHAALADYEAGQSEDVTPVDSVARLDWRHGLIAATHAALADYEAGQSEDVTPVDSVATLEWRQQLRSATDAVLAEHEALPGADIAPSALSSEEMTASVVDQSAHAAWKEALKVETEAHLASWTAPLALESAPIEVETAIDQVATPVASPAEEAEPMGWLQPLQLQQTEELAPAPQARRRLGKRWIEGLRFETEVWFTTMRRTQRESELELEKIGVEPPSAPIWAEEELAITPPPLEMRPEPVLALTEETTLEAEQPELTTLPSQIEPQEAVRPWVTSLRLQTEEELAAKPTWVTQLDQASQAELATLGAQPPTWIARLDETSRAELATLSTQPPTWVAGLRAETDTQLAQVAQVSSADSRDDPSAALRAGRASFSRSDLASLSETTEVVTRPEVDQSSSLVAQIEDQTAKETPEVVTTPEVDQSSSLVAQVEDQTAKETPEVVTTPEVDQSSSLVAQIEDQTAKETPEVVTTPEVDQSSSLVAQIEDQTAKETPEVVTTPEVDQSSSLVAQIEDQTAKETPEVVTTPEVDQSSSLVAQIEDQTAKETPEVITTPEVDQSSSLVAQIEDQTAKETTEVVTTPEIDEASEFVAQVEDETAKETTEVVTTPEIDEASEFVAQIEDQTAKETLEVVTTPEVDQISSLVTDVAPEISTLSQSGTNGTATSHPVLRDQWQLARQAWQVGKHEDAYAIYQGFFRESDEYDAQLDDALSAWTRIDDAPFLAFQLLGDVYRRMRRMQDAVKQYREAIKRI